MDESIKCECGLDRFWYFGEKVRCPRCLNEYKVTVTYDDVNSYEKSLVRRFNSEEHRYNNWEKYNG